MGRFQAWLAVATGILLISAACGGSGAPPAVTSSPTSVPSASAAASAPPPAVLTRWGIPPAAGVSAPYLADKWGYFKAEGITVDYFTQPSGVTLTQALIAGDIDFVSSAIEIPMQTAEQGQKLRTIVGQDNRPATAIMVPKDSTIAKIADLKGKKVGVAAIGSSQSTEMKVLISEAGLALEDVTLVPVGVGPTAVAAFRAKQIDALDSSDPAIQVLTMSGEAKIIVDLRKGEGGATVQAPSTAICTTSAYIQKNPDVVHRVVRAIARAEKRAHDHPDEAYEILKGLSFMSSYDATTLKDIASTVFVNFSPVITEAQWTVVNLRALAGGTLKQSHPYADVVGTEFVPDWDAKY